MTKPVRRPAALTLLVTMLLATAVAGCGKEEGAAPSLPSEQLRKSAQAMLHERGRRLAAGDVEGYLKALSPQARQNEEAMARGAGTVPLVAADLVLGEADADVAGKALRNARIEVVYRYRDLPEDNPFRFQIVADLEEREGSWSVASSRYDAAHPTLPPWATGPVEVNESEHFLAFSRPGLANVERVLEIAEEARAELQPKLTLVPDDRHLLALARNPEELLGMMGSPSEPQSVVALAVYIFEQSVAYGTRPENRFLGVDLSRVFLGEAVAIHPTVDLLRRRPLEVFQHELGHLALSRFTRPATPSWVVEGAAMFLSGERLRDGWKSYIQDGSLERFSVAALSEKEQIDGLEYPYANAVVLYLVERYGVEQFWEFYRNFKDVNVQGSMKAVGAEATHRVLRRFFQLDEQTLDERVKEWLHIQVGT